MSCMTLMRGRHLIVRRTWLNFMDMVRSSLTVSSPIILIFNQAGSFMLMMRFHVSTPIYHIVGLKIKEVCFLANEILPLNMHAYSIRCRDISIRQRGKHGNAP